MIDFTNNDSLDATHTTWWHVAQLPSPLDTDKEVGVMKVMTGWMLHKQHGGM